MDPVEEIEKVSQELILLCLREHEIVRQNNIPFQKFDVGIALERVGDAFAGRFHYLYGMHALEGLDTDHFSLQAMRICLQMTRDRSVLNTVLACAFLVEYVSQLGRNRNCFCVAYEAYKCMKVVLERWLGRERDHMTDAWRQFVTHVRDLNQRIIIRPINQRPIEAMFENENVRLAAIALVDSCRELPEADGITTLEREFLENDVPLVIRADFGNLRECTFCLQECEMFVNACARKHGKAPNYMILL